MNYFWIGFGVGLLLAALWRLVQYVGPFTPRTTVAGRFHGQFREGGTRSHVKRYGTNPPPPVPTKPPPSPSPPRLPDDMECRTLDGVRFIVRKSPPHLPTQRNRP